MDKIIVGGNVSGNVGSCEVKSTDFKVGMIHTQTVAVNSCTGEMVASNTYISLGIILIPVSIILFVGLIFGLALAESKIN